MGSKRKLQAQDASIEPPASKKYQAASTLNTATSTVNPLSSQDDPSTQFLEKPQGQELKREVQLYEQLSSEDIAERIEAGDAVVSGLFGGDGVLEAVLQRHLERRLIRGLASGRKAARLGFSVVLTEVLQQLFGEKMLSSKRYSGLTLEKVLEILIAKTKPLGDLSGQEERDHAFGLLFGLQSFVRAKILFRNGVERWTEPLEVLLQLAVKKPWMREECGWIIVEALQQMEQTHAEDTVRKLYDVGLALTPEGVGVWLAARKQFPGMKFPDKPWGGDGNPLEHIEALSKVLKESRSTEGDTEIPRAKQAGHWNPKLHFVWHMVTDLFIKETSNEDAKLYAQFKSFWKVAVDENLFSSSASSERKYWGFQLFQKMVRVESKQINLLDIIFSQNLMRCLINQLHNKDRFLFRAAEKSVKAIQDTVQTNPNTIIPILSNLIGNGIYNFDQATKTKTVDKLLSQTQGSLAGNAIKILRDLALEVKTEDSHMAESRRQNLGDYILSMVRHVNPMDESKDITWVKTEALPTLAYLAYCKDGFKCKPDLSDKSRTLFQNRLTSAFAHLMSHSRGFFYPCELLLDDKFTPDAIPMDEHILEASNQARGIIRKIYKKAKKSSDVERKSLDSLSLLYALVVFQLYNGEADAANLLDELKLFYDSLIRKDTSSSSAEASVIIVEVLLSLVSRQSALFRKVAEQVFTAFCSELTGEGIKLMTDVLESTEGLKGQQELFDEDGRDGEGDDGYTDDFDSDVEVVGSEEDLEFEQSEEGDDPEDEERGNDEELTKLDVALAEALGTHTAHQDINAESSNSDADMTDSEMLALDTKLVEIFSQRKKTPNKKKESKNARENIINFKNRVLDLLDIYVKKQARNPLSYSLLLPLLQLIRTTTSKQTGEKAHGVISTFVKASRGVSIEGEHTNIDMPRWLQLLEKIHAEASKNPAHAFARAASAASLLVASSLHKTDKNFVKKIASVYRDTQVAWLQGRVKIQASFFHDWVNWCQSHTATS